MAKKKKKTKKRKNELLVLKLRTQVDSPRLRGELQEVELPKSIKKAEDAVAMVIEESAKSKAAKDVIKSLTAPDRFDKTEIGLAKSAVPSNVDLIKQLDSKAAKQGKKVETFSVVRSSQPSLLQLKGVILSTMAKNHGREIKEKEGNKRKKKEEKEKKKKERKKRQKRNKKERKKRKNELLNQEVLKLRAQVDSSRLRGELQEVELPKSIKKAQDAVALVIEESSKSKAAKDVIKSQTAPDRLDKTEIGLAKSAVPSYVDLIKQLDS